VYIAYSPGAKGKGQQLHDQEGSSKKRRKRKGATGKDNELRGTIKYRKKGLKTLSVAREDNE